MDAIIDIAPKMPILKLSSVAGLQHCNIKKKRVGNSDKRVVSENLFAIADIIITSKIDVIPFVAIAA